jgi:putative acetyltransferase
MRIRQERRDDYPLVRAVNRAAFETSAEADLVDVLRVRAHPVVSLVAEENATIVGHIFFSPVTLGVEPALTLAGLAPMAVAPACQRRGIGSALVKTGLDACRQVGFRAVVVLGHAGFYPRFGFAPASRFDLKSTYDVPDDVFMAVELVDGALRGKSGIVRYHPAFEGV